MFCVLISKAISLATSPKLVTYGCATDMVLILSREKIGTLFGGFMFSDVHFLCSTDELIIHRW